MNLELETCVCIEAESFPSCATLRKAHFPCDLEGLRNGIANTYFIGRGTDRCKDLSKVSQARNICRWSESETLKEKRQPERDLGPESCQLRTHPSQDSSQQRWSLTEEECGCGPKLDPLHQLKEWWGMR